MSQNMGRLSQLSSLGLYHMSWGFFLIFFSSLCGPFLAQNIEESFALLNTFPPQWAFSLLRSAHGHTSLLGMVHILFGLTLHYGNSSIKLKYYQTAGLLGGDLVMMFFLPLKSLFLPPHFFLVVANIFSALGLMCFWSAILSHSMVLLKKTPFFQA